MSKVLQEIQRINADENMSRPLKIRWIAELYFGNVNRNELTPRDLGWIIQSMATQATNILIDERDPVEPADEAEERARFEAWAEENCNGHPTDNHWIGWKARAGLK